MNIQVSARMLLVVAIVLLAANLVVMFGVYGASPAHAQGNVTPVGIAFANDSYGPHGEVSHGGIFILLSNGKVPRANISD